MDALIISCVALIIVLIVAFVVRRSYRENKEIEDKYPSKKAILEHIEKHGLFNTEYSFLLDLEDTDCVRNWEKNGKVRTMGNASEDRYVQLKVAVQDMLIELDITPEDIQRRVSPVMDVSDKGPVAKLSVKVCQKLIDAGVLKGTQVPDVPKDDLSIDDITKEAPGLRSEAFYRRRVRSFVREKYHNFLIDIKAETVGIACELTGIEDPKSAIEGIVEDALVHWARVEAIEYALKGSDDSECIMESYPTKEYLAPPTPPTSEIIKESKDKPEGMKI